MRARLETRKIILNMNPDELRDMADKMEERWKKLRIGQTTFVDFLHYGDDFIICLHLDQEWFHKKEKES